MLAFIDPPALPALRTAGIFFLIIDLLVGAYFFRNRRQFSVVAKRLRAGFSPWGRGSNDCRNDFRL